MHIIPILNTDYYEQEVDNQANFNTRTYVINYFGLQVPIIAKCSGG